MCECEWRRRSWQRERLGSRQGCEGTMYCVELVERVCELFCASRHGGAHRAVAGTSTCLGDLLRRPAVRPRPRRGGGGRHADDALHNAGPDGSQRSQSVDSLAASRGRLASEHTRRDYERAQPRLRLWRCGRCKLCDAASASIQQLERRRLLVDAARRGARWPYFRCILLHVASVQ